MAWRGVARCGVALIGWQMAELETAVGQAGQARELLARMTRERDAALRGRGGPAAESGPAAGAGAGAGAAGARPGGAAAALALERLEENQVRLARLLAGWLAG